MRIQEYSQPLRGGYGQLNEVRWFCVVLHIALSAVTGFVFLVNFSILLFRISLFGICKSSCDDLSCTQSSYLRVHRKFDA